MDHSKYEMLVQKHIDRELSPVEEHMLELHLAECPRCAALCRDLERLDGLLSRELFEVEPPQDLVERVMSALPETTAGHSGRRRRTYLAWGSVAAAAVLLAAGVGGVFSGSTPLDPPPQIAVSAADPDRPELVLPHAPVTVTEESVPTGEEQSQSSAAAPAASAPSRTDAASAANPGEEPRESEPATYSSEHQLPSVASGSQARGAYSMITLASVANCDALRPQVNGPVVTFYILLDDSCLQWQVSADGSGNAVFLGECDGLPDLPGLGSYHSVGGEEWYAASSANGAYEAENTPAGLLVNGKAVSADGGGYLVSWAPDGSKVLFTDYDGNLLLYYPAEDTQLSVASGVASAAWSGSGSIVLSAYDNATGFYSIFRVSVP
ncbi:MAG: zf-HC2 domain-containing protein [Firmicutes bacterium]|nr:zf-HC2 domain-containing protein [Bacillota bacterium]